MAVSFNPSFSLGFQEHLGHHGGPLIILGSARRQGCTHKVVDDILQGAVMAKVDLQDLALRPYAYEDSGVGQDDAFFPLMEHIVAHHTILVIATPVYWYTMSAIMKNFWDRWTDILYHRQDLKKGLEGKKLMVVASYGGTVPRGFEDTFQQICHYLSLEYKGTYFVCSTREDPANHQARLSARHALGLL